MLVAGPLLANSGKKPPGRTTPGAEPAVEPCQRQIIGEGANFEARGYGWQASSRVCSQASGGDE